MDNYIKQFADQFSEALKIGDSIQLSSHKNDIRNILLCGMGGSGIGGALVKDMLVQELTLPMQVSNSYFLPKYVNEHTLLIFSSYSGNTEETLSALEMGLETGAKIVCVGTNGRLQDLAEKNELDFITIPSGFPPRAALAYSSVQLFFIFNELNLLSESILNQLKQIPAFIDTHSIDIQEQANEVAGGISSKKVVVYSDQKMKSVCRRFLQQLSENAKSLGWANSFPEMNHNELVGWASGDDALAVVVLRNQDDYVRNQKRMEVTLEMLQNQTPHIYQVWSKGENLLEQFFYLVHLTDWLTYELAQLNDVDAMEIDAIRFLKEELAKL